MLGLLDGTSMLVGIRVTVAAAMERESKLEDESAYCALSVDCMCVWCIALGGVPKQLEP